MPLELGFTVNAGPLTQISVPITPDLASTAISLVYHGYEFWQARQRRQTLDAVITTGGALVSAPASFDVSHYKAFRRSGPGLNGFARLASRKLGFVSMPNASTSCDSNDSGMLCLRAITTALLCFYDAGRAAKILIAALPGRLIRSQLDNDDFEINGATISALKKYVDTVQKEEVNDPIQATLFRDAKKAVLDLLQDPNVTALSLPYDLLGSNPMVGMGRATGLLIWLLTDTNKRQNCYPTASLLVWALAFVLQKLGMDVRACRTKLDSEGLYKRHVDDSLGSYSNGFFGTYLVTCSGGNVDPLNHLGVDSNQKHLKDEKPITTAIRNIPFLITSYEIGMHSDDYCFLEDEHNEVLVRVSSSLFLGLFNTARLLLEAPDQASFRIFAGLVNAIETEDFHNQLHHLNAWAQNNWVGTDLSGTVFRANRYNYLTFGISLDPHHISSSPGSERREFGSYPWRILTILTSRALAYAMLVTALGIPSSSDLAMDLEVRLRLGHLPFDNPTLATIGRFFSSKKPHDSFDDMQLVECGNSIVLKQAGTGAHTQKNRTLLEDELSNCFFLYTHLLTANPLKSRPLNTRPLGIYFEGMTVLRRYFFDQDLDFASSKSLLIVADGLPLGLPTIDGGWIVASALKITKSLRGLDYNHALASGKSTFFTLRNPVAVSLGASDLSEFRVDTEVDWEGDETALFMLLRRGGQAVSVLDFQNISSKTFELLWMERARLKKCECEAPVLLSERKFSSLATLEVSKMLNTANLTFDDTRLGKFPAVGGFHRCVFVAKTIGNVVAQFRALEFFLSTISSLAQTFRDNRVPLRSNDEDRVSDPHAVFARVHFVSCMKCWERTYLEREESWFDRWSTSQPTMILPGRSLASAPIQGSIRPVSAPHVPSISIVDYIIAV